ANLIHADQHSSDPEGGRFFMRVEFHLEDLAGREADLRARFEALGERFRMQWELSAETEVPTVVIFASRSDHCLLDLLWRWRRGELAMEVPLVVSNHERLRRDVEQFGIPFACIPMDDHGAGEAAMLEALAPLEVDLVVLARYMRILSADFLDRCGCPFIN